MTEREQLLEMILNNPDDDAPRLVYADWLQENGKPLYAQMIRLQIQYPLELYAIRRNSVFFEKEPILLDEDGKPFYLHQIPRRTHYPLEWILSQIKELQRKGLLDELEELFPQIENRICVNWKRGLIHSVLCSVGNICDNLHETEHPLEDLFRWHPIQKVTEVVGVEPRQGQGTYAWEVTDRSNREDFERDNPDAFIPKFLVASFLNCPEVVSMSNYPLLVFYSAQLAETFLNQAAFNYLNRSNPRVQKNQLIKT